MVRGEDRTGRRDQPADAKKIVGEALIFFVARRKLSHPKRKLGMQITKKQVATTWRERARVFLETQFLPRTNGIGFLAEQFRSACDKRGIGGPEDLHEWGAFMTKAKRDGVIVRCGFGIDQHGSPKSLWKCR